MSNSTPPPFMPFSDEEGYYVRDPQAVFTRTDAEFRTFAAHLSALAAGIAEVDTAMPPEQRELAQRLQNALREVQGSTKLLLALTRELATYNVKLTEQRQSARDAFNAGWQARYQDILSQLHPADQRMLRWVIEYLEPKDSLPF